MAKVGNWGKVLTFRVSDKYQLSFSNFNRKINARWAQHKIVQKAVRSEYLGIDQGSVTMDVVFSAEHGQRPYRDMARVAKCCKNGVVNYLYVGGRRVGNCKFYIKSISQDWEEIWNKGEIVKIKAKITFEEYH